MDRRPRPPRYNAVVASAAVMTRRPVGLLKTVRTEAWQEEAWRYFDEVGELRFAIGWISNAVSRLNLVAARQPAQLGDDPEPLLRQDGVTLTDAESAAIDLVEAIAGGPEGQSGILSRLATLLSVPGIGWVLIEDADTIPATDAGDNAADVDATSTGPAPGRPGVSWSWRVLSNDELRAPGGDYEVQVEDSSWRSLARDHVLIKVWRPHPRRSWEPDSPCRAARTMLSIITMLDESVIATGQSRLAGAGLLVLPSEVEFKPMLAHTDDDADTADGELVEDDFADVLVETMTTPIGDRGSAAAVVPLTVKIPGEYVDKVKHITFWSEFSEAVGPLQERSIKRFALAVDMPPEIVTGVSGMNHWGAWQVQEEAVTLHVEPIGEIITEAFTIGFLRPALEALGHAADEVQRLMVFPTASNLTIRPDRSDDAIAAYDRVELSGTALRRETGLSETDKPDDIERARRLLLRAMDRAPDLAPQLLPLLGVTVELEAAPAAPSPRTPTETTPDRPTLGPPGEPAAEPEAIAAAAGGTVLEACDALVYRALERAGTRLRQAAARGVAGGGAAVAAGDVTTLHTRLDAVSFASLTDLLDDAWVRVPIVAARLGIDPDALTGMLDAYTRGLLATGHAHDHDRLADALGLTLAPA